jgi:hypothetical protein
LTKRSRSAEPTQFLHEAYDIWCQTFNCVLPYGQEMSPELPSNPREVIARSLACVDCFKIIYTELCKHYKHARVFQDAEKQQMLRNCQEVIMRLNVLARGFACLC